MAVIDAADRFGVAALEDDSEQTIQERERIAMALADFAVKAPKPAKLEKPPKAANPPVKVKAAKAPAPAPKAKRAKKAAAPAPAGVA